MAEKKKKSAGFSPSDALWSVWGKVQNIKKAITAPFRTNTHEIETNEDVAPQKKTFRETLPATPTNTPMDPPSVTRNLVQQPHTRSPAKEPKRTPIDKSEPASSSSVPSKYASPLPPSKLTSNQNNAPSLFEKKKKSQDEKVGRKRSKKRDKKEELRRMVAALTDELVELQNHNQNEELEKVYALSKSALEAAESTQKAARKDIRNQFKDLACEVDDDKANLCSQAEHLDLLLDTALKTQTDLSFELDKILEELEELEKPHVVPNKDCGSIIVFLLTSFVSLICSILVYCFMYR